MILSISDIMIHRSTIQLLRFHFSFFLMPVYWFALSQVVRPNAGRAFLIFIILHVLIYPSSNGFNSYMDRDEESIGGLKSPLQPTRQLMYASLIMDGLAMILSFFISIYFVLAAFMYIIASRAYSARSVRLKKYPVGGFLTVVICQGALVFFYGLPWLPSIIVASCTNPGNDFCITADRRILSINTNLSA